MLSQCNAQMKISFPGLISAQYKSINIIIIVIIIIIIIIIIIACEVGLNDTYNCVSCIRYGCLLDVYQLL